MDTKHIDKSSLKHFTLSFAAALLSTDFALGLGLGKEAGDYLNYKHFCLWDLLFDLLGIVLGTLVRMAAIRLILGMWKYTWF